MRPIPCTLPAASGGLITGSGYIVYWSVRDTTASTGSVFQLYDGNDANGQLLLDVSTVAGQSTSEYIGKRLLFYTKSLYYNLASGTIEGAVTVHACDSTEEYRRMLAEESALAALMGTG
jgi:hypothetical protein